MHRQYSVCVNISVTSYRIFVYMVCGTYTFLFQFQITEDNYEEQIGLAHRAVQVTEPDEQSAERISMLSDQLRDTAMVVENGASISQMVQMTLLVVNYMTHGLLER